MSIVNHSGGRWRRPDGRAQWRLWHEWLQATTSADDIASQLKVPLIDTDYVLTRVVELRARAETAARLLLGELAEQGTAVERVSPATIAELMLAVAGDGGDEPAAIPAVPETPEEAAELLMRGKQ